MSRQKEKAVLPKLRFPEFRDAGPWKVKRLGDEEVAQFARDRIPPENIPIGHYVSTVNLLPDFGGLDAEPEAPPPNNAIAYLEGDILMSNIRPYLKKVWVADRSGGASNDVLVVRAGKSVVRAYLGHLLMSDRFITHVMEGAKGVKMPRGDLEQIQDFRVPVPPKPEQQKIADCLSSLDDLIRAEEGQLATLKDHKKGLMQQLFPREGETTPRLRFPEFRDAGPWEVKRLGEVCDMQAGDFIPASKIHPEQGQGLNPCYGGNGLRGFTESFTHIGSFPLIGRQGAYCGNVQLAEGKFHATEHAVVATPTESTTTKFLYFLLVRAELSRLATGQAQPGLSVTLLNGVTVPMPPEPEQQKIADCLSSLDDLIRAKSERIDALKRHKKGLMQQLFPQEVG